MVGQRDLKLVLPLLIIPPVLLSLSLLTSLLLVEVNTRSLVGFHAGMILVFEHATQTIDSQLLFGPVFLFLVSASGFIPMLAHLLVGPFFVQHGVHSHTVKVAKVLTLKLATSGYVLRLGLATSVSSLLRALHFPSKFAITNSKLVP